MDPWEYTQFIATEQVTSYENRLANSMYNTNLDFSSYHKSRGNIKQVMITALQELFDAERRMIDDISTFPKMKNISKPKQPSAQAVVENFEKIIQYNGEFNYYIQSLFMPQELSQKETGIDWQSVSGDPSDYDYFLFILQSISRKGGFWAKQGVDIESSEVFGDFKKILNNNGPEEVITESLIKSAIPKYFQALKLTKSNDKKIEKQLMDMWQDRFSQAKKTEQVSWDSDFFFTILLPPMINKIKGTKALSNIAISTINNRKHWDTFYKELKATSFTLSEITFLGNEKTFLQYAFKGDYGEMVQAVLGQHSGIETKYMGSKAANEQISKEQSYIDTLITVNGNKYGIQDKEYRFISSGINTRVYGDKNAIIDFSQVNLLNYFSQDGIKILASLLELYNEDSEDKNRLNTLFAHLDLEQIRAVGYLGVESKPLEALSYKDIVYSLIYRITGQYFPASYIFAQRINDIKTKNPVYDFKQGDKVMKKQIRGSYKIKDFDKDKRNNLLDIREVDAQGHTKLKLLDINTAMKIARLLVISAMVKH